MVQPDWKEGDVAWEADLQLANGYVCHVRVLHPSPRGILAQLCLVLRWPNSRAVGEGTGRKPTKGVTAGGLARRFFHVLSP